VPSAHDVRQLQSCHDHIARRAIARFWVLARHGLVELKARLSAFYERLNPRRFIAFLVDSPLLALVPCAVLFLLAARTRDWLVTVAATAWLVYAGYEWLMLHRVLCSGECNIRIDLLVLHPALIGLTIIALVVGLMRRRRG